METMKRTTRAAATTIAVMVALPACEVPEDPEPAAIEVAYLLDRVNGIAPPRPICEQEGALQVLLFESIALAEDDTYGRLQETRIDGGPVIQQREQGEFVRSDSTILLVNAADDTLTLELLDEDGAQTRRIHPCGDVLRYGAVAPD
jgi:hypothetical protein